MKTRVITAIVMAAVIIPLFIYSHTLIFPIFMAFIGAVGVYEMQGCIGAKKRILSLIPCLLIAAGLPFAARYLKGDIFTVISAVSIGIITYSFILSVFSSSKYTVETAGLSASTAIYISLGFSSVVLLRDMDNGAFIFLLAFIIPWATDTFAYFTGCAFGKHKLIPEVSPKKTVEGAVGGTLCAVLFTLLYGFAVGKLFSTDPNYLALAISALVVSLLSQCGDLVMSLVKRKFGVKDYGKLFPGHGGVLDRFDSVVCVAPVLWLLLEFVPSFKLFS